MNSVQPFLFAPCAIATFLVFFAGPDTEIAQEKRWEIKVVNKTGSAIFVNLQGQPGIASYPGVPDSSSREKGLIKQPPIDSNLLFGGLMNDGSYYDQMFEGQRSVTVLKAEWMNNRWVPGEQLWNEKVLINANGILELGPKGLVYRNAKVEPKKKGGESK
jgi:hypothetical protein